MDRDHVPRDPRTHRHHDGPEARGVGGHRLGEQRGAGAREHQREDGLALRGDHGDLRLDACGGEGVVEQLAGRGAAGGRDDGVPGEVGDGERAARGRGSGREHDEHLLGPERDGHETLVGGVRDGHADLGVARGNERRQLRRAFGVAELHGHAGVRGAERPDERRHRVDRERRQRAQVEVAGFEARDRGDGGARGVDVAERLPRRPDQCFAGGGEHRAPPDAVEQPRAQLLLELPDRLRHRGLGDELGLGCSGEPALVDHGEEQPEAPQIHR